MKNMEGVDIYQLIGICAVVVAAWVVQVIGFSTFKTEVEKGPPSMNVVDFDKGFSEEGSDRPLVELGYDVSVPFVSESTAQERIAEHNKKKWLGLLAGIAGAIGVCCATYKLWEDWITSIVCVLLGPLGIAWGIQRSNRRH